ncbi:response regulator, partial [Acinetobacter baumannii]
IEDDLELGRGLHAALRDAGHEVLWLRRAQDGADWMVRDEFDAILLDLSLPDGDGMHLLKVARSKGVVSPILLISAREGLQD